MTNSCFLIDTHTHFDVLEYQDNLEKYAINAYNNGVKELVIIGLMADSFKQMVVCQKKLNHLNLNLKTHLAFGLHPLYIKNQQQEDLYILETYIKKYPSIAIGEIGLDTFEKSLKEENIYQKQKNFFIEQIQIAKKYDLPILLHIRKAHADVLKILKQEKYNPYHQGGIAHSFSGGINEAIAFVQMGFKLGITGQITNPNAKKLRQVVNTVFCKYGVSAFVIETDSPDMLPIPCQKQGYTLNEPANLIYVLQELSNLFNMDRKILADKLWENSYQALKINETNN